MAFISKSTLLLTSLIMLAILFPNQTLVAQRLDQDAQPYYKLNKKNKLIRKKLRQKNRRLKRRIRSKILNKNITKTNNNNYYEDKHPDAKKIMVFGGPMAEYLAKGLSRSLRDNPTKIVINATSSKMGINHQNRWGKSLNNLKQSLTIDAAIILIGYNDLASISNIDEDHKFGTSPWRIRYLHRLKQLAEHLRSWGKPILWISLPPVANKTVRKKLNGLNELQKTFFQKQLESNIYYYDIGNIFMDLEGNYTQYGFDIDGHLKQLRLKNGIGFTKAGRQKIAFLALKETTNILENNITLQQKYQSLPTIDDAPSWETGIKIKLNYISNKEDSEIYEKSPASHPSFIFSPAYETITLGKPRQSIAGRVDDFSLLP